MGEKRREGDKFRKGNKGPRWSRGVARGANGVAAPPMVKTLVFEKRSNLQ